MVALGRVELPTFGLGNRVKGPTLLNLQRAYCVRIGRLWGVVAGYAHILRTDFPLRLAVVSKKSYSHVLVDVI
jgi:hypothetical protein